MDISYSTYAPSEFGLENAFEGDSLGARVNTR